MARAAVDRAQQQLDDARLRLSWTEIRVRGRRLRPGPPGPPGQPGRARPDAALDPARPTSGSPPTTRRRRSTTSGSACRSICYVDAYPDRVFKGRVAGFSPGTGLSESLLPPENATGNYVKVTQRLPVRIELAEPNPDDTPLFVGLSVVPHVRFKEAADRARGRPAAARRTGRLRPPDVGGGPAGLQPGNRGRPRRTPP